MFFFFSSRRRHTRCGRDWSSDVCSSDLGDRISSTNAPDMAAGETYGETARSPLTQPELRPRWPQILLDRGEVFFALRSEEHTSELQSRPHLVCRLLLEKKKQYNSVCECE